MRTGTLGFMIALVIFGSLGTAGGREVVVEVDAGAYERRDTPILFPLPEAFRRAASLRLECLNDHKAVPVQLAGGRGPEAAWILHAPLAAGAKRRYRLTALPEAPSKPAGAGPEFRDDGKTLTLNLDGRPVLTYHTTIAKPPRGIGSVFARSGFLHPVATRSGLVVTDDFPPDHAHQHGVFFAWVNTTFDGRHIDFWNQPGRTGRVGHESGPRTSAGPVFGEFQVRLRHDDLTAPGGAEPVLDETWDIRAYNVPGVVLLDFESIQTCAGTKPLKINKYHYGGMGLRGNRAWLDPDVKGSEPPDRSRGGRSDFLTSEGKHRANGNHTRPLWVDLSGEVEGRFGGIAILDHPGNFRFPQPVRLHPNKPYFCFAPMVLGEFEIAPGRPYVSRYRIYVHDGAPDARAIERVWNDYAEPPKVRIVEE